MKNPQQMVSHSLAVWFELSDGNRVTIESTGSLTSDTLDDLIEYLAVYRNVLAKRDAATAERDMKSPEQWGDRIERGRDRGPKSPTYSRPGDDYGFFFLRMNGARDELRVMVSSGDEGMRWEHVSVSLRTRCPTWEEMCWVKSLFWHDHEVVIQYHPAKEDYVSYHPFCLHLWRPIDVCIPTPPVIAVGPKTTMAAMGAVPR